MRRIAAIALIVVLLASVPAFAETLKWSGKLNPTVQWNNWFDGNMQWSYSWDFGLNLRGVEGTDIDLRFNYNQGDGTFKLDRRTVTINGRFIQGYPSYKITLGHYDWDKDSDGNTKKYDGMIIEGPVYGQNLVVRHYDTHYWRIDGLKLMNTTIKYDRNGNDDIHKFTYDGYQGKLVFSGSVEKQKTVLKADSYFRYPTMGFVFESNIKPEVDSAVAGSGELKTFNHRVSREQKLSIGSSTLTLWGQVGINEWGNHYHGSVTSSIAPWLTLRAGVEAGSVSRMVVLPEGGYGSVIEPKQFPYVKIHGIFTRDVLDGLLEGIQYEAGLRYTDLCIYLNASKGDAGRIVGWNKGIVAEGPVEGLKVEFRNWVDSTKLYVAWGKRVGEMLGFPRGHAVVVTADYQADLTEGVVATMQKVGFNWSSRAQFRTGLLAGVRAQLSASVWWDILQQSVITRGKAETELDNGVKMTTELSVNSTKAADGFDHSPHLRVTWTKGFSF